MAVNFKVFQMTKVRAMGVHPNLLQIQTDCHLVPSFPAPPFGFAQGKPSTSSGHRFSRRRRELKALSCGLPLIHKLLKVPLLKGDLGGSIAT